MLDKRRNRRQQHSEGFHQLGGVLVVRPIDTDPIDTGDLVFPQLPPDVGGKHFDCGAGHLDGGGMVAS